LKIGWQTKRLIDVSAAISTGPFGSILHKSDYVDHGVPLVNPINIIDDRIVPDPSKLISKGTKRRLANYVLAEGDIVVARRGEIGRCAVVGPNEVGWLCGTGSFFIRPLPSTDSGFLAHLIRSASYREKLEKASTGTTMKNLSNTALRDLVVDIPPLSEQQRIVGILDEAFDGITIAKANAEKNLQNARALFESHIQSVFTQRTEGWVRDNLKNLTTKIGSGATPRGGNAAYQSEGISLVRSLNVHDLGFRYKNLAFLDDDQADGLSNVEVQRRDVLLNITGASVARCCIVPEDALPARVNQHVSIIRPISDKLDSDFLHYLLISKPFKDQLLRTGAEGGSTRQAITKAQIQDFIVEYPEEMREQKSIAAGVDSFLTETQRLESIYQQKLAALDALKKSLLHQAFSGQL
jgi:type I restriction enzyme S subunit